MQNQCLQKIKRACNEQPCPISPSWWSSDEGVWGPLTP